MGKNTKLLLGALALIGAAAVASTDWGKKLLEKAGIKFAQEVKAEGVVQLAAGSNATQTVLIQLVEKEKLYNVILRVPVVLQNDPNTPVVGATVKAYDPQDPVINNNPLNVVDPKARILDKAVTDAQGVATLAKGILQAGRTYYLVIDGGDTYYDRFVEISIKGIEPDQARVGYTLPLVIPTYKVGKFAQLAPTDLILVNVTSGQVTDENGNPLDWVTVSTGEESITVEFTITIDNANDDAMLEAPALILEQNEDIRFKPGALQRLNIIFKEGTDMGIGGPVLRYLQSKVPLLLKPATEDAKLDVNTFTIINIDLEKYLKGEKDAVKVEPVDVKHRVVYGLSWQNAKYTVHIAVDKTKIEGGEEVRIYLDDLGGKAAISPWTNEEKAKPAKLVVRFVK